MSKRRALGQDPLAWIKKTDEDEAEEGARDAGEVDEGHLESGVGPTEEVAAVSAAASAERPTASWPFLLIMTVDFLLLLVLGVMGFNMLQRRIDRLNDRLAEQTQRIRQLESSRVFRLPIPPDVNP